MHTSPLSIFNTCRDHCTAGEEDGNVLLQGLRQYEYLLGAVSYLFISIRREFLFCFYQLALACTQQATQKKWKTVLHAILMLSHVRICGITPAQWCLFSWAPPPQEAPDIIFKIWYQSCHTGYSMLAYAVLFLNVAASPHCVRSSTPL